MNERTKPALRPSNPQFSSGPCTKRPDWSAGNLESALVGRSHRSGPGKIRLKTAIEKTRELLEVPESYRIGIVPASDTGAMEMALWSLLGARGVDVLAWESFGKGWLTDVQNQLRLENVRAISADYGELPDLSTIDFSNDVVFTWNGTTSGVRVPDGNWIPNDRQGLTICDATSAAFAQPLDWEKLDVVTYSWQKVLGGEAQHGMLILSPRAVERLESYSPPWPLPKIFRLTKSGKLIEGIFEGLTINTPSMLCVEDYLDTLNWAEKIGGLRALHNRANQNADVIYDWVAQSPWIDCLAKQPVTRSNTSVCLVLSAPEVRGLSPEKQSVFAKGLASLLDGENVARDIGAYRDAPPGLRIWTGATVEKSDLEALLPWLDWAYGTSLEALTAR